MQKRIAIIGAALFLSAGAVSAVELADQLQDEYRAVGAEAFDAEAGAARWSREVMANGQARSCAACHGSDLRQPGKHIRTGRAIEPLAPSVNPQRLVERKEVEKWFLRNCKWTYGRECSPQEKGDFVAFIRIQ